MEDDGGNKKRRAEKQWRREEVEAGLDERDEPVIEGNGIQVASTEELSRRRFVRVGRRRGAPVPEEAAAPSLAPAFSFAAAASTTPASPAKETTQAAEQPKKNEEEEEKAEDKGATEEQKEEKSSEETKEETKPATPVKTVDFGKTPDNITVPQFSFGLPATSSPTTGGFVFSASSTSSTTPTTGFFFGAGSAKTDAGENARESKQDEKKESGAAWTCNCCTEVNPESNATCSVCMVARPAPPKPIEEGWTCACCTQLNPAANSSCSVCMVPKPL